MTRPYYPDENPAFGTPGEDPIFATPEEDPIFVTPEEGPIFVTPGEDPGSISLAGVDSGSNPKRPIYQVG
jgi:hypothetical protein